MFAGSGNHPADGAGCVTGIDESTRAMLAVLGTFAQCWPGSAGPGIGAGSVDDVRDDTAAEQDSGDTAGITVDSCRSARLARNLSPSSTAGATAGEGRADSIVLTAANGIVPAAFESAAGGSRTVDDGFARRSDSAAVLERIGGSTTAEPPIGALDTAAADLSVACRSGASLGIDSGFPCASLTASEPSSPNIPTPASGAECSGGVSSGIKPSFSVVRCDIGAVTEAMAGPGKDGEPGGVVDTATPVLSPIGLNVGAMPLRGFGGVANCPFVTSLTVEMRDADWSMPSSSSSLITIYTLAFFLAGSAAVSLDPPSAAPPPDPPTRPTSGLGPGAMHVLAEAPGPCLRDPDVSLFLPFRKSAMSSRTPRDPEPSSVPTTADPSPICETKISAPFRAALTSPAFTCLGEARRDPIEGVGCFEASWSVSGVVNETHCSWRDGVKERCRGDWLISLSSKGVGCRVDGVAVDELRLAALPAMGDSIRSPKIDIHAG